MIRKRFCPSLLGVLLLAPAVTSWSQEPNFAGTWKQSNDRCLPKRTGNVTRHIDQSGSGLVVETTIVRASGPPRHAIQRFTTNGTTTISTGADGDEFHTSIARSGESLIFSIEEHEDGRVLHSKETWTLIDNKAALQVDKENLDASPDGNRKQTLIFLRQPASPVADHPSGTHTSSGKL